MDRDDFARFEKARAGVRAIMEKYNFSLQKLRPICRQDCLYLHPSVVRERLSTTFGISPDEAKEWCRLCREIDQMLLEAGLF